MDTTQTLPPDILPVVKQLYRLPPTQTLLLIQLVCFRLVTLDDIIAAKIAPTAKTARTVVFHVRKFLKKKKIELQSAQNTGYWLEVPDQKKIAAEIHEYNYPTR